MLSLQMRNEADRHAERNEASRVLLLIQSFNHFDYYPTRDASLRSA